MCNNPVLAAASETEPNRMNTPIRTARLEAAVNARMQLWEREAAISACEAVRNHRVPMRVVYPTGLVKMQWEPDVDENGARFPYIKDCSETAWNEVWKNGGRIIS